MHQTHQTLLYFSFQLKDKISTIFCSAHIISNNFDQLNYIFGLGAKFFKLRLVQLLRLTQHGKNNLCPWRARHWQLFLIYLKCLPFTLFFTILLLHSVWYWFTNLYQSPLPSIQSMVLGIHIARSVHVLRRSISLIWWRYSWTVHEDGNCEKAKLCTIQVL